MISLMKIRCADNIWSRVIKLLEADKVLWKGLNVDIAWAAGPTWSWLKRSRRSLRITALRQRRGTKKKKEAKKDEGAKGESNETPKAVPKPKAPTTTTTQEPI